MHPGVPEYNLRGQLPADGEGRFEFETVVPSPYTVPHTGATGQLLAALGRVPWRPAHVHFKITHPDAQMLTTQIYFEGRSSASPSGGSSSVARMTVGNMRPARSTSCCPTVGKSTLSKRRVHPNGTSKNAPQPPVTG